MLLFVAFAGYPFMFTWCGLSRLVPLD